MKKLKTKQNKPPRMHVYANGLTIWSDDPKLITLGIEEDFAGRDVLYFEYKGKTYKSLIFNG